MPRTSSGSVTKPVAAAVNLREVTAQTVRAVCALKTKRTQTGFVAPNALSIAQAYFEPAARFRAVQVADKLVGFVMRRPTDEADTCFLWRFMIAGPYQGKGYGRAALALVFDVLRQEGYRRVRSSYVRGKAGPRHFYKALGFSETGESLPSGEQVIELMLG